MARREEILRAAQHTFLKYGFKKITLEDIAEECGIKKTALYYYFKSKEEILSEMIQMKMEEFSLKMKEAVMIDADVQEKLRTYMKTKINLMQENMPFMKLFEKERLPVKAKTFLLKHKKCLMERDFCLVKDIIKQGVKDKKVSFKLNDSLVLMILGVTYGTFIGRFMENADWNIDEMIDTSIEVIFKGIE